MDHPLLRRLRLLLHPLHRDNSTITRQFNVNKRQSGDGRLRPRCRHPGKLEETYASSLILVHSLYCVKASTKREVHDVLRCRERKPSDGHKFIELKFYVPLDIE